MAPSFVESPMVLPTKSIIPNGHPTKIKPKSPQIPESTHPTRSLTFLQKLNESQNEETKSAPLLEARVKLRVIVVGGGLGGLACAIALARRGHTVTVLEQATQLGEVISPSYPSRAHYTNNNHRWEQAYKFPPIHQGSFIPGA